MKALKACLLLLALFFALDFTTQSYAQTSCSAPTCPTTTISGHDKVSHGESKSYTLSGASSSQNIRWSVDNPNASISGDNNGAILTVSSACNCNNGAITITAKDIVTGCSATFRVQAGTWVRIFYCQSLPWNFLSPPICLPQYPSGWRTEGLYRYQYGDRGCCTDCNMMGDCQPGQGYCWRGSLAIACWNAYIAAGGIEICPPLQWRDCDNPADCQCLGTGYPCYDAIDYGIIEQWKCPTTSQSCNIPCSLGITDFKASASSFDPYSETVCLSGLVDEATDRSVGWTIEIKNGAGEVVKQFSGGASYVATSWNGRDSSGNIVPGGNYTAYLTAKTSDGGCTATSNIAIAVESSCIDSDHDGYYKYDAASCTQGNDCNDGDAAIYPGASEICDGVDNNCNVETDEGEACDCSTNTGGLSTANMSSGNLHHDQELFSTKGTSLTLHYNSIYGYNGSLGKGWGHTYDVWLKEHSDGSILLRDGNERRLYIKNGSTYTSQPGDYSTLTKNTDDTFTITHKDGLRYNFNSINKISSIVDRNGNTVTFTYNTDGDLATITDTAGRTTTLSYNADHRIATINDPNSNVHTFIYNGNDLGGVSTSNQQQATSNWTYSYYSNSFMQSKTDPNGYTTTYTYDENHRVISGTAPEGNVKSIAYPSTDDTSTTKTTTVTEKDGGNWTYTYDTQAGTLTQKTDPESGTTSYTYDTNRNMTSKTEPDGSVTSYTYDTSGNRASTTDALGQTTTYTYNSYGQATSITAPDNTTTSYEYDASGNLTKTTDSTGASTGYQYDSKGNVTKITNAAGQTTFTYDQSGNLASITDSTGATTTFTYDAAGNMISQTDASGATTRFEYNSLNQLVRVIDPNGNSTTNTYDNNGNKTSSTDANGNVTYYEYNYKGQLTKVKDSLGNVTTYTYGGTGCSSCGGGTDKLTEVTDANENVTKYEYDTLGRLTKETDPLGNAIAYSYDSKGNLISKTDANGATISYSYDSLERLLKKTYPNTTTETYTYDSKGNILTATNPNISYTLSYNTNGKATSVTDSSGRTVSYQYDAIGNKTKLTYPEGSTATYSYDSANRLKSIVNGGGKTYTFTYDSLGRRSKLSLPNGTYASYSYDTSGRLTSLVHKTSTGSVITQYSYMHDKVGNRLSKTNTNVKNDYAYDPIYRLLQSLPTKLSGKDITQENKAETFAYDAVGNRLAGPEAIDLYSYNQGNQLTNDRKHQYEYDKNGNLVKKTETGDDGTAKTYTYSYDYENRLIKVVKQESEKTVTVTFKYDPFGRRLEKKLEETKDGKTDVKTYSYVYDNEDIILEYLTKAEDGKTKTEATKYVHGPGIDEPLAIERKGEVYFYHADGLGSITALTDNKQKVVESYTYSAFGEVKRKGDKVKNTYTFTAREWDEEIGFYFVRARYLDSVTGRWTSYDPLLHPANGPPAKTSCRSSISYPSFEALKTNPQTLNPYVYVENRPTILTDPSGFGPPSECSFYQDLCCRGDTYACYAYKICKSSGDNPPFLN